MSKLREREREREKRDEPKDGWMSGLINEQTNE